MMNDNNIKTLNRRDFLKGTAAGLACLPALRFSSFVGKERGAMSNVALIKTSERSVGVRETMGLLEFPAMKGKSVVLKPNFNTSDPFPGSTHNDTLSQLVKEIHERGAKNIVLGERSGPPDSEEVMLQKGIFEMSRDLDFKIVNYEKIPEEDWVPFNPEGNHWENGFHIPRTASEAEYFISTCCLKTHGYGGVFTLSLKLAVGLTPKRLMRELHGKRQTDMRKMIAEINLGYKPDLIVLDGVEGFVDGGPSKGEKKVANVFLASSDRVALDAAGLAVLKDLGANDAIMGTKIFEQEQIKRAVELNLGAGNPEQIEFVTPDRPSQLYADKLKSILAQG
ncbi:MAG: DUF362 domain-containing protein [Candidatus Aminicenantes bacterium]|nr:MAG: DUF362 domain-containing protein [Candidatus Aminicenantes bacterium]